MVNYREFLNIYNLVFAKEKENNFSIEKALKLELKLNKNWNSTRTKA